MDIYSQIIKHCCFLKSKRPKMAVGVEQWLRQHLTKDSVIWEWGSGGSTIYIANLCKGIISIEHNFKWWMRMQTIQPDNVVCIYVPLWTNRYAKMINYFNGEYDLIIIDGRQRMECLKHAINRVKNNGYVLFDDSQRTRYKEIHLIMSNYKSIIFKDNNDKTTIIWKIERGA